MTHDELPRRESTHTVGVRLDAHFAKILCCDEAALRQPDLHIVAPRGSHGTVWHGQALPIFGILPASSGGGVIACVPALAGLLAGEFAGVGTSALFRSPHSRETLTSMRLDQAEGEWSRQHIYVTDGQHFRPHGVDPSVKVERTDASEAPPDAWLSLGFDGPSFVVHDNRGTVAARAGTRRSSDAVWEIAAVTEPAYRGRGLATVLTVTATAHVLAQGLLAIWIADVDDQPSQRLVERLGYHLYGDLVTARFASSA